MYIAESEPWKFAGLNNTALIQMLRPTFRYANVRTQDPEAWIGAYHVLPLDNVS